MSENKSKLEIFRHIFRSEDTVAWNCLDDSDVQKMIDEQGLAATIRQQREDEDYHWDRSCDAAIYLDDPTAHARCCAEMATAMSEIDADIETAFAAARKGAKS